MLIYISDSSHLPIGGHIIGGPWGLHVVANMWVGSWNEQQPRKVPAMAERILDPQYLEAYRDELDGRFQFVTELCDQMRPGNKLGVEPGFGLLDSAQAARQEYQTAHEETWNNLQKLRADLYGAIVTINESLGVHTDAEAYNVAETESAGGNDGES